MYARDNWKHLNIVFVRHAQSRNNTIYDLVRAKHGNTLSEEKFEIEVNKLHDSDCGLSDIGLEQAKLLGDYIHDNNCLPFKSASKWNIISSPMKRCLLTSQQVAAAFGKDKPVLVHPRFFESGGCFQKGADQCSSVGLPGMTVAEVTAMFPSYNCLSGMEQGWYPHAQKETEVQFRSRMKELVEYLWSLEPDEEVGYIIVCHGNVMRSLSSLLLGSRGMVTTCNTGLTHMQLWHNVRYDQKVASMQFANRVDHLLGNPSLISGNDVFGDHWMQEFALDHRQEDVLVMEQEEDWQQEKKLVD